MNKPALNILLLLFVLSVPLSAQVFNSANFDRSFPCTIILKSGESKDVTARYSHPDILKDLTKPFETVENGTIVNIDKALLETFFMNNQCWVERSTPIGRQWVILARQGPIEHVIYVTSDSKGTSPVITTGDFISKDGQAETTTSMAFSYKKKMSQFVADYPQLATKVSNGDKGYGLLSYLNVVDEYNAWYQKNNPDKIKYYRWFAGGKTNDPAALTDVSKIIQHSKDSAKAINKAIADSRPSAPAPEIASKKANIPPKKETFSAKVKRYEAEGHKIAVVLQDQKTTLRATIRAVAAYPKEVGFEGEPEAALVDNEILSQTIAELNKIYGTTIFEAVDLNQIPVTEIKYIMVENWWSTCYKTVVSLSHLREFNCSNDMLTEGNFEGTASIGLYANVFEYIDDGKKSTDGIKRLYVLASGVSDEFEYTQKDWPVTFEKLEALVDWDKVKQRYAKKKQDQFAKLVEKWD